MKTNEIGARCFRRKTDRIASPARSHEDVSFAKVGASSSERESLAEKTIKIKAAVQMTPRVA